MKRYSENKNEQKKFTTEYADLIFLHSKQIAKLINPEKTIILAPGRSPYFHAIALNQLGVKTFNFAFSSYVYCYNEVPTKEQILAYRQYLTTLGLQPELLYNTENEIVVLDIVISGTTIDSLIFFFSHWQYEVTMGSMSPNEWAKNGKSFDEYQQLERKIKGFRIPSSIFTLDHHIPPIIDLPDIHDTVNIAADLGANTFPVTIPHYSFYSWNTHPNDLLPTESKYYQDAIEAKIIMENCCRSQLRAKEILPQYGTKVRQSSFFSAFKKNVQTLEGGKNFSSAISLVKASG